MKKLQTSRQQFGRTAAARAMVNGHPSSRNKNTCEAPYDVRLSSRFVTGDRRAHAAVRP